MCGREVKEKTMEIEEWLNRGRVLAGEIAKTIMIRSADQDPKDIEVKAICMELNLIAIMTELLSMIYKLPDPRERMVLTAYYCNNKKLKEIADNLGISMAQLARIKKAAI